MYAESELYRAAIESVIDSYSGKSIQLETLVLLTAQYKKSKESEENENDLHA